MNKKCLLIKWPPRLTSEWFFIAAIVSLLMVATASCKKDNNDYFIIGNIENSEVEVANPDTVFPSFSTPLPVNYNIDVDKDGRNDFRFFCSEVNVNNETSYDQIEIICLNNQSFIGVQTYKDTLFLDTWSGTYDLGGKKETNIYKYYSHTRPYDSYSVERVDEEKYIVPFKKHAPLDGVNWISDTSLIYRSHYSWSFINPDSEPDWIKDTNISYDSLNPFPDSEIRYIAIKKTVKWKTKQGWIKAFLSHRVITVLEVALQK